MVTLRFFVSSVPRPRCGGLCSVSRLNLASHELATKQVDTELWLLSNEVLLDERRAKGQLETQPSSCQGGPLVVWQRGQETRPCLGEGSRLEDRTRTCAGWSRDVRVAPVTDTMTNPMLQWNFTRPARACATPHVRRPTAHRPTSICGNITRGLHNPHAWQSHQCLVLPF